MTKQLDQQWRLAMQAHDLQCEMCGHKVSELYCNSYGGKRGYRCRECASNPIEAVKVRGKICSACNKHKEYEEFPRSQVDRSGLHSQCKKCKNQGYADV